MRSRSLDHDAEPALSPGLRTGSGRIGVIRVTNLGPRGEPSGVDPGDRNVVSVTLLCFVAGVNEKLWLN